MVLMYGFKANRNVLLYVFVYLNDTVNLRPRLLVRITTWAGRFMVFWMIKHTKRSHTLKEGSMLYLRMCTVSTITQPFIEQDVYTAGRHMSVQQLEKVIWMCWELIWKHIWYVCLLPLLDQKTVCSQAFVVSMFGSRSESDEQKLICWVESVATQHCSQKGAVFVSLVRDFNVEYIRQYTEWIAFVVLDCVDLIVCINIKFVLFVCFSVPCISQFKLNTASQEILTWQDLLQQCPK